MAKCFPSIAHTALGNEYHSSKFLAFLSHISCVGAGNCSSLSFSMIRLEIFGINLLMVSNPILNSCASLRDDSDVHKNLIKIFS